MKKLFSVVIFSLLLSSCATHDTSTTDSQLDRRARYESFANSQSFLNQQSRSGMLQSQNAVISNLPRNSSIRNYYGYKEINHRK